MKVQIAVLKGRHTLTRSRLSKLKIVRSRARHGKIAFVGRPSRVASVPVSGSGTLVLNGKVAVQPGQIFALGYGPHVPNGFLATVTAIGGQGSQTVLQTRRASLEQAGAAGKLDLSNFHEVGPGAQSAVRAHRVLGHGASFSAKAFNPDLTKEMKCSDGASASIEGNISVSVTPSLHAHFSLFHGLTSADFSLTGAAKAGLTATADASAGCKLNSTKLLRDPLHIATFEGAIGPIPVVVVLQGQVFVDGNIAEQANIKSNVDASASVTGGVKYDRHKFSPIFSGPNASFTFNPPAASASGKAKADVEPALQMLLYGVGGPQLGVKGGLDFEASTTANPWWTLTAPFSINASLTAPSLDLDSGDLTLFHHTFNIASAGGPFTPPPPPPPPPPRPPLVGSPARQISNYVATPDLGCTLDTTQDSADEFYTFEGAPNDACGTFLSLDGTLYGPATIPAGDNLGDYTAWTPVSQTTTGDGSAVDPFVTVTTVAAEDTGVQLTETDRWTVGASTVDSSMSVTGPSGDTDTALLYRAADCYVGNDDHGFGSLDPTTETASCLRDNGDGTNTAEQLVPLSGGASSVEDAFDTVWSDVGSQQPLSDTCQCDQFIDDGFATDWPLQLNGESPVTESSRFAFLIAPASVGAISAARARGAGHAGPAAAEPKDATRTMTR